MLAIGLTGGIGSGKSTVAELFAKLGTPIIDADIIAREVTQPDQPAFLQIVQHFDESILTENGTLNRPQLRKIIFTDLKQKLWLENLLHPLIRQQIETRIRATTTPYCIAVIPLLLESRYSYPSIKRILVVDSPIALQIERVLARDKTLDKRQIETIIKVQIARDKRLTQADDIVVNDGHLSHLSPQVDKLHQQYLAMSSQQKR